jgi:hypothetical protein
MSNGGWFVILLIVYEENFDAPWAQFIAAAVSADEAARCAADMEVIAALERDLPVHMKRGGQTARYVLQVQAYNGISALMRAQSMLSLDASVRRRYQLAAPEIEGDASS